MKRIITFILALTFGISSFAQGGDFLDRATQRSEIVTVGNDDDTVVELFTMEREDGHTYYISMARPGYGNEIIQMGIGPVYSMFIILGDTYEEALEIMTTLKEFYGEPKGSVMEVQGCVSALLPEDNNIETITVTARPGFLCRRLEFSVPRGNDIIADYVSKSDFSALLNGLKFYHKLHPNEP